MEVYFQQTFRKQFKKSPKKIQLKFEERFRMLVTDGRNPLLKLHILKGDRYPMKSMNVTGDYGALFIVNKNTITFYEIGTHSELYK